ncbi:MAG: tetratricopeptide repeat protein [Acidobacteria bacterium]|nr:tetratricopeptide repeat protein [Acidobacteriota bacterium]
MQARQLGSIGTLLLAMVLTAAGATQAQVWPDEYHLNSGVRANLAQIQQFWSEWLVAYELDDSASEEEALEVLVDIPPKMGMKALPELSFGASARAVESARLGDYRRAQRALTAAEQLDPRRPETAFARAAIHRLKGEWWATMVAMVQGYARGLQLPLERRLWFHNFVLWALTTLLLAGCAFVALLMLARGPALFGSLLQVVRRFVPVPIGIAVIILLLLWPLALSAGVLAVALNWSILLWGYCQRSERWVLIVLFLLFGVAPMILDEQRRRVAVDLSPMARATESARLGRLRGHLFSDLQRLAIALPDSAAVSHLMADQNRRIGQCDQARELYQRVVVMEPENAAAWIDYGSCYFSSGEYDKAIEYYRRGISIDDELAEGHFNVALTYSELYRFAESGRALTTAQRIDSTRVAEWLDQTPRRGAAEVGAGLRRSREIRRDLQDSWVLEDDSAALSSPWRDYLSLPLALAGIVLALVVGGVLPRTHGGTHAPPLVDLGSRWSSLYRILVPGLPELEGGDSLKGVAALVVVIGLLLIPWVGAHGYRIPWGFEPTIHFGWTVLVTGLGLFLLLRWRREAAY